MRCLLCSFELPSDWPPTKVGGPDGQVIETAVCSPCSRRFAGIAERPTDQVMTPTRTEGS